MKISEMTNDQAAEAMIRLCGPFSNICDDEEMLAIIDKLTAMKGMPTVKAIAKVLPEFAAFGLKKHKADLYEIIGTLQGVAAERVGGMNFVETVNTMQDSVDDVLKGFFTQSAVAEKLTGAASA